MTLKIENQIKKIKEVINSVDSLQDRQDVLYELGYSIFSMSLGTGKIEIGEVFELEKVVRIIIGHLKSEIYIVELNK